LPWTNAQALFNKSSVKYGKKSLTMLTPGIVNPSKDGPDVQAAEKAE
jgi:hypothetical protein